MEMGKFAVVLVLAFLTIGVMAAAPTHSHASARGSAPAAHWAPSTAARPAAHAAPATVHPADGFSRTVMVETFTAEWCYYCGLESRALYNIEQTSSPNVVVVPELHICYSQTNCGDNYQSVDTTDYDRMMYYGVTGFPTVYFDGGNAVVGSSSSTSSAALAALQTNYQDHIDNESSLPANLSIAQTAQITSSTDVTVHASIASAVNGTFRAISYLDEYIGKNSTTYSTQVHVLSDVVREMVFNQSVSLTAGMTTPVTGTVSLGSGWNLSRLSVVTFVQQVASKVVENANMAPVTTLAASVEPSPATVDAGNTSTITVTVTNSSTGTALSGASVSLSSSAGGSFSPSSGVTASDGTFASTFTAPVLTSQQAVQITAQVDATGYVGGPELGTLVVNPVTPPTTPGGLTITPVNQSILVGWNAPTTGGGGVFYHLYRSTTPTGGFTLLKVLTGTSYLDSAVLGGGQIYWYEVSASNTGGFSPNTTAVSANPVVATELGLPSGMGWWISVDSAVLVSANDGPINLYLPKGFWTYTYGAASYGYEATVDSASIAVLAGQPAGLTANFSVRYGLLQGTVTPAGASVSLDGNPLSVGGGTFTDSLAAGSYTLTTTFHGYVTDTRTVVMTPGNTTTVAIRLSANPSSSSTLSTSGSGGLTDFETYSILTAIGAAAVAGILIGVRMTRKRSG